MIQEEYVSLETAKLLKEKGFDEECNKVVHSDTREEYWFGNYTDDLKSKLILCPTQSLAMRWLREVYKIDIDVDVYSKHSWNDSTDYCISVFSHGHRIMIEKHEVFNTYEEACESAIKYCLENLI